MTCGTPWEPGCPPASAASDCRGRDSGRELTAYLNLALKAGSLARMRRSVSGQKEEKRTSIRFLFTVLLLQRRLTTTTRAIADFDNRSDQLRLNLSTKKHEEERKRERKSCFRSLYLSGGGKISGCGNLLRERTWATAHALLDLLSLRSACARGCGSRSLDCSFILGFSSDQSAFWLDWRARQVASSRHSPLDRRGTECAAVYQGKDKDALREPESLLFPLSPPSSPLDCSP